MYIYTEQDIRFADEQAVHNGLNIVALMENAGRALFEEVVKRISKEMHILILAGKGNNGGDGIVLARYLQQAGYHADLVFPIGKPKTEAAKTHLHIYNSSFPYFEQQAGHYDVIIDALLGVGTKLPLKAELLSVIQWANEQNAIRIAVDLPTGVEADRGNTSIAFRADYTFALHGLKPSAFLQPSAEYYGIVKAVDIGLPHQSKWRIWTEKDVLNTFPGRPRSAHKGTFGTGLLVAGSDEMPGSACISAIGALRSGIGKLVIATSKFAAGIIAGQLPEATYYFDGINKVIAKQFPEKMQAAAIGPGLEDFATVEKALENLYETNVPLVIDAGALQQREYPKRKAPIIVTPHPGEFCRMTGISMSELQANRLSLASEYAETNDVIVVLKGANTVIAFPDGTGFVNDTGNASLAKGGSGDALTGIVLAFLCTHDDPKSAVANAVFIHGACADEWVKEKAMASLLASDFSRLLPIVIKRFEK